MRGISLFIILLLCPFIAKARCESGFLPLKNLHEARLNNITLVQDQDYEFCLDLPVATIKGGESPFVTVATVNKGNSSCSNLHMLTIRSRRKTILPGHWQLRDNSYGSQPGTVLVYSPGTWRIKLRLLSGCDRYDLYATWSVTP